MNRITIFIWPVLGHVGQVFFLLFSYNSPITDFRPYGVRSLLLIQYLFKYKSHSFIRLIVTDYLFCILTKFKFCCYRMNTGS